MDVVRTQHIADAYEVGERGLRVYFEIDVLLIVPAGDAAFEFACADGLVVKIECAAVLDGDQAAVAYAVV